ncbi:MAG: hypothetical protein PHN69_08035 [Candidatus Pacebacteria bacterium]|nr:hypothetical protein [Candidatus Paceibacterota bacterium]
MEKEYKCGYTHCLHGGTVASSLAIKDGVKYYHPDCLQQKKDKRKVVNIFYKHINKTEVGAQLTKIINEIVDSGKATSEFLLYAICYVVHHKIPLKHAAGLFYIINDDKIKKAYSKMKAQQALQNMKIDNVEVVEAPQFELKESKNKGWGDLLR